MMNIDGSGRRLVAAGARDACWTADGKTIVYLKDEAAELQYMDFATKGVFSYDVAGGRTRRHPNPDLYHLYNICCTPDGNWLIATVHAGMGCGHAILAIEAKGKKVFNLKIPGCRPNVSRDGKRIAWGADDNILRVGDLILTEPEPKVTNIRTVATSVKPIHIYHVVWSPDGKYVAFRGTEQAFLGSCPGNGGHSGRRMEHLRRRRLEDGPLDGDHQRRQVQQAAFLGSLAGEEAVSVSFANCRFQVALAVLGGLLAVSCENAAKDGPAPAAPEVVVTKSGIEMVVIPAGRFQMGSDSGKEDESPAHVVQIDSLLMDRYEMTQANYAKVAPINGSRFKGPDRPVEMISWAEAALYCNKRSRAEGFAPCYNEETGECDFTADGYRLPTEAEWEYACRAGTTTPYSFGGDPRLLGKYAWYGENAGKETHPVGKKKPNPWGLYDMYGNVAEWCNDAYDKDYYKHSPPSNPRGGDDAQRRVIRGGAWNSSPDACRSAYRVGENPGFEDACFARDACGFRCVRKAK